VPLSQNAQCRSQNTFYESIDLLDLMPLLRNMVRRLTGFFG
jgi:hypothetical protein